MYTSHIIIILSKHTDMASYVLQNSSLSIFIQNFLINIQDFFH